MKANGDSPGFTLLEMVITIGVVSAMLCAFIAMMGIANRSEQTVQGDLDWVLLQSNVLMILDNPDLCGSAFRDGNGKPAVFPTSANPPIHIGQAVGNVGAIYLASSPVAATGMPYGSHLTVEKVELRQTSAPSDTYSGSSNTFDRSYARLYIQVARRNAQWSSSIQTKTAYGSPTLDNADTGPFVTLLTDPNTGAIVQCQPAGGGVLNGSGHISLLGP